MFKKNEKIQVRSSNPRHAGKVGYFRFVAERSQSVIMTEEPLDEKWDEDKIHPEAIYFAIHQKDAIQLGLN